MKAGRAGVRGIQGTCDGDGGTRAWGGDRGLWRRRGRAPKRTRRAEKPGSLDLASWGRGALTW